MFSNCSDARTLSNSKWKYGWSVWHPQHNGSHLYSPCTRLRENKKSKWTFYCRLKCILSVVCSIVTCWQFSTFYLYVSLQYELRVTASDNFKENYTTVVINVKDVNDNSPIFEKTSYRTQITEEDDRALPKRVLKVSWSVSLCSWKAWDCMMMTLCCCCCCEMACLHRSTFACW